MIPTWLAFDGQIVLPQLIAVGLGIALMLRGHASKSYLVAFVCGYALTSLYQLVIVAEIVLGVG